MEYINIILKEVAANRQFNLPIDRYFVKLLERNSRITIYIYL